MLNDTLIDQKDQLFADRYRIDHLLGWGAAGRVYLAYDTILNEEKVALKVLSRELAKDESQVKRFIREAQVTRKVTHPNVVRTYDVGLRDDIIFLSMEYVEGSNLKDHIKDGIPSISASTKFVADICRGLGPIHDADIIHRDLKLNNIMLTTNGVVKIADFGVAKQSVSTMTMHDELIGSATHMAPEVWQASKVTPVTDIYALGIVAFELFTGELPFSGTTVMELMWKHIQVSPPIPSSINKELPAWIDNLLLTMLAKDQSARYQSASEILAILERAAAGEEIKLSAPKAIEVAAVAPTLVPTVPPALEPVVETIPEYRAEIWDPGSEIFDDSNQGAPEEALPPPIMANVNDEVSEPDVRVSLSKPIIAFITTIMTVVFLGGVVSGLIGRIPMLYTELSMVSRIGFSLVQIAVLSLFAASPIFILSVVALEKTTARRLSLHTAEATMALLCLVPSVFAINLVWNGFLMGYSYHQALALAFSSINMDNLWYVFSLAPYNGTVGTFFREGLLPLSIKNTSPPFIAYTLDFATSAFILIITTKLGKDLFHNHSKFVWALNLIVALGVVWLMKFEVQNVALIQKYIALPADRVVEIGAISLRLSPYQILAALFNWFILFSAIISGHILCRGGIKR